MSELVHKIFYRNTSLGLEGEVDDYPTLQLVPRFNNVGFWSIDVPSESAVAKYWVSQLVIRNKPGVVIEKSNGDTFLSGPVTGMKRDWVADKSSGQLKDITTFHGPDDMAVLAWAMCSPDPSLSGPPFTTQAYDVRTGIAETIMRQYVDLNLGPGSIAGRSYGGLTLASDGARGLKVTGRARFQTVIELLYDLALAGGGLGFRVVQTGGGLQFQVYQPTDRTLTAIFSQDIGNVREFHHTLDLPIADYFYVAGQGVGTARTVLAGGPFTASAVHDGSQGFWDLDETYNRFVQTVQVAKPQSYWKLNESVGALTVADSAGSSTGTVNGTITFGQAMPLGTKALFNGSTGYITAAATPSATWTIAAAFDVTGGAGTPRHLLSLGSGVNDRNFYLLLQSTDKIVAGFTSAPSTFQESPGGATFGVGSGRHYAMATWDGTVLDVYIDGVLDNTFTPGATPEIVGSTIVIGGNPGNTQLWFGDLDNVEFFSKALTAADALAQFKAASRAYDTTGVSDGTYTGGYTLGKPSLKIAADGYAVGFDGSSGCIVVPVAATTPLDVAVAPVSMECLVKFNSVAGIQRLIFRGRTTTRGYGLSLGVNGNTKFNLGNAGGANFDGVSVAVTGQVYHVVGIIDGANSELWVNGVKEATGNVTVAGGSTSDPLVIGAGYDNAGANIIDFLNGTIDVPVVYPGVHLTSAQIADHFAKLVQANDLKSFGRFEMFIDRRDTNVYTELSQELYNNSLSQGEVQQAQIIPVDTTALSFENGYDLGDKVTVITPDFIIQDVVREANLTITPDEGQVIVPLVGTTNSSAGMQFFKDLNDVANRVTDLERLQ